MSKTSILSFVEQNIDITIIVISCSKGFSNGSSNMLRVLTCNFDLTERRSYEWDFKGIETQRISGNLIHTSSDILNYYE